MRGLGSGFGVEGLGLGLGLGFRAKKGTRSAKAGSCVQNDLMFGASPRKGLLRQKGPRDI